MARKLSRVARCVLNIATASALSSAAAFGQIGVEATPASQPVDRIRSPPSEQPRRRVEATAGGERRSRSTSPGPKAFQNPFARREKSPRFVMPRLQPGPLSRWHRADQTSAPPSDQRPIQALGDRTWDRNRQRGDLSGPLAHEERRHRAVRAAGR